MKDVKEITDMAEFENFDEPVVISIEDSIDLHHFLPKDITSVVEEYLAEALAKGFGEVRLIHGRGAGVQRAAVHKILEAHPLVKKYYDVNSRGATVVEFVRRV